MLPVKPETRTHLKHLKSMVTHRLPCISYNVFVCWPTQRVGLSLFFAFFFLFTGQLNVLAYLIFFTGQLNVLAYYNAARWISSTLC